MKKLILGILDCDKLSPELQGDYACYAAMFKTLFSPVHAAIDYRRYDVLSGDLPQKINECDAYLITGSKAGVYEELPWIFPLRTFIQKAYKENSKLVGLCFGHQILADSLGGKTEKSAKGWGVGAMESRVVEQADWMPEKLESLCLLYSHQDQVSQLPPDAKLLYTSDFCQFSAFYIPGRVVGFQGHPEFTVDYCKRLMFLRQTRYAPGQYEQALQTLSHPLHSAILAQWIINFLQAEVQA